MRGIPDEDDDSTLVSSAPRRAAVVRPRAHVLEVTAGPAGVKGRVLRLERDAIVLGRGSEADFALESDELSRQHVRLTRRNGEYTCTDLDSLNGLYLNGLRVHSAVLRDGDQVQLGDVTLLYREGS